MIRALLFVLAAQLPGRVRERVVRAVFGYEVHPQARVRLCLVSVKHLSLGKNASIGTFTVCKGLDNLILEEEAQIGRLNWITATPKGSGEYFGHLSNRDPSLVMRRHTTITHRHLIDCTDRVEFGEFSGIGGYHATVLTHSVDLNENRQDAAPIEVGEYTFVGTNCILLSGSVVPSYSAVAAGSVFRGRPAESGLYAGVPAKRVADLPTDAKFFAREHGRIG
jgi:acetyltransferase-like isoleucine patch superfamily enzyme